jgi:DNA polymerase-4
MLAPDFDRGKGRSNAEERNKGVSAEPARRRKILHIDMDAFFASVEQRDNPELRGKPVAVRRIARARRCRAASYEARVFGVHSSVASVTAKRKCRGLISPIFLLQRAASASVSASAAFAEERARKLKGSVFVPFPFYRMPLHRRN